MAVACICISPGRGETLVRTVTIDPSDFFDKTATGTLAARYARPNGDRKPLTISDLVSYGWLKALASDYDDANAALRDNDWSAGLISRDWPRDWRRMPDGAKVADVSFASAVRHAMDKCLGERNGDDELINACGRRVLGPYYDKALAAEKSIDECWPEYSSDADPDCLYALTGPDYENDLFELERAPLSVQRLSLQARRPDPDSLERIAERLTIILESIRSALPPSRAPCSHAPIRVVITDEAGADGLNVATDFCASELRIPLKIVEDIWARAVFRATRYYEISFSSQMRELGDDLARAEEPTRLAFASDGRNVERIILTAPRANPKRAAIRLPDLKEHGVYAMSLGGFVNLASGLPSIAFPVIRAGDLAQAIEATGDARLIERWGAPLSSMRSNPDASIEDLDFSLFELEQLLTDFKTIAPEAARDEALQGFIDWHGALGGEEGRAAFTYSLLLSELSTISALAEAELYKAHVFILAHESWHLWMDDYSANVSKCVSKEFDADYHAARMYVAATAKQGNLKELANALDAIAVRFPGADSSGSPLELISGLLGRDPDAILYEVYAGTRYENALCHPPLEQRVAALARRIEQERAPITGQILDQLRCLSRSDAARGAAADACINLPSDTGDY